jgi:hypothetical protein
MNEIYWITRLDAINTIFSAFLIISIVALVVFIFIALANLDYWDNSCTWFSKKYLKICCPILFISILGTAFVPTTKEALLIYGVGGTIDYIKSKNTVKKLPDKAIKALDKFLDEYNVETKSNENGKKNL